MLTRDDQDLFFTQEERTLIYHTLAGHFPNYESILLQNGLSLETDRLVLLRAIERMALITDGTRP